MDTNKYAEWLVRSAGLENRSARDVISRTRRVGGMISLDSKMQTCDLLHELGKKEQFKQLTISVRSQLRRALKLYRDFKNR